MVLVMGLMILGHMVLCFFAFKSARQNFEESTRWLRAKFTDPLKKSFPKLFFQVIGSVGLFHSPHQLRQDALEIAQDNKRGGLLILAMAGLASLVWLFMFNMLFKFEGSYLLFAGAVAHFSRKRFPHTSSFFWFVFFTGLFVMSISLAMRPGNLILRFGSFQEILFILADNRWPAVLGMLLLSVVLTPILRLEGWAWVAALLGVVMGAMSLSVALAFVMGEALGWHLMLWYESRKKASLKKLTLEMLLLQMGGTAVFLILYAILRSEFSFFKFGGDLNNLLARLRDFLFMIPIWLAFQTFILLIWGHFRAK